MPTLDWIGKQAVVNHDKDVPFRLLKRDPKLSVGDSQNLIIKGDNLEALKALMPYYVGKVKCVYIDPPYNTGNEEWAYNDAVNSPQIRGWLGRVVGNEATDLSRHDKWLCMMYPRLKLLRELMRDDGVIFISMDDSEPHHLRLLLEEIFGEQNFIATFVRKRRASSAMAQNLISQDHEYVFCFTKSSFQGFKGNAKNYSNFKNPDNDPNGEWTLGDLTVGMTKDQRPNQYYDLIDAKTGRIYKPNPRRVWTFIPESMKKEIEAGRVVFPNKTNQRPMVKRYKKNLKSAVNPISTWIREMSDKSESEVEVFEMQAGLNTEGTRQLQEIFENKVFDYPKPVSLVRELIRQVTDDDSIVLDSFGGSGTTAQAVIELNHEGESRRRFILVELDQQVAETVTCKRIGVACNKNMGFQFMQLDTPLFDKDGNISEPVTYLDLARYIFFTETQKDIDEKKVKKPYIGTDKEKDYCLFFTERGKNTFTRESMKKLPKNDAPKMVYADRCLLSEETLRAHRIVFKQIPYQVKEY